MDALEVKTFCLGPLATNAYLVIDRQTKTAVIVDAPQGAGEVKNEIDRQGLKLLYVLLTHGHADHIAGLLEFDARFYIHRYDEPFLADPSRNLSSFFQPVSVISQASLIKDRQVVFFAGHEFEVIHTPGHSPGSVCFKIDNYLFSGDTLFFDSVGRTDLPGASQEDLFISIKEKLLPLGRQIVVLPGHGGATTLGREIKRNPFLVI